MTGREVIERLVMQLNQELNKLDGISLWEENKIKEALSDLAQIEESERLEFDLGMFCAKEDLQRKFRYSRLEFYADKEDTWDRRKYENDARFRAEVDIKVAHEVACFNVIIDFVAQAIYQAQEKKREHK